MYGQPSYGRSSGIVWIVLLVFAIIFLANAVGFLVANPSDPERIARADAMQAKTRVQLQEAESNQQFNDRVREITMQEAESKQKFIDRAREIELQNMPKELEAKTVRTNIAVLTVAGLVLMFGFAKMLTIVMRNLDGKYIYLKPPSYPPQPGVFQPPSIRRRSTSSPEAQGNISGQSNRELVRIISDLNKQVADMQNQLATLKRAEEQKPIQVGEPFTSAKVPGITKDA
jgi:hypothetical protein